jgi:hypothetical protein
MKTLITNRDIYDINFTCGKSIKGVKSKRLFDMFKKLHHKKCKICNEAVQHEIIDVVNRTFTYN